MSKSFSIGTPLPVGTVTFLFTGIQGSTPLWEREPEKMAQTLKAAIDGQKVLQAANWNDMVLSFNLGCIAKYYG